MAITLNEFAKKNAGKIFNDGSLKDCEISVAGETVLFTYKPVKKKEFLKGQESQNPEKFMNYILTHSLWNSEKGSNGDFWSLKELEQGLPDAWQIMIFGKILTESGFNMTREELGF